MFFHAPHPRQPTSGTTGPLIQCACGYSGPSVWTRAGAKACPFCKREHGSARDFDRKQDMALGLAALAVVLAVLVATMWSFFGS